MDSLLEEEEKVKKDIEMLTARSSVRDTDCGTSCTDKIALEVVKVAVQDLKYKAKSTDISSLFQNTFSFSVFNPSHSRVLHLVTSTSTSTSTTPFSSCNINTTDTPQSTTGRTSLNTLSKDIDTASIMADEDKNCVAAVNSPLLSTE